MSKLSDRIAQLSPEKRELLLQKLQRDRTLAIVPTIQPQSRNQNIFPLSFAQERLWFLNRLESDNSFYNQPTALRLTGNLDLYVLKQALREIIGRHASLRTNFVIIEEKVVQVIKPIVNFDIPILDLTDISSVTLEKAIQKLAEQEAEKPFNLEQDLLLRTTLLKLRNLEHIVFFTTHHIVSDAWSTGILVKELASLYQAFLAGKTSPLPELTIQYADFAVWQRDYLQGDRLNTQLNYWKQQLGNNPSILNLPTDYRRPNKLTYQGATQSFVLSESLTKALNTLSRQEGVTLFMTLMAAFQLLLHRYSHQAEIFVGTPIANRNHAEIENLIGFFVNTLVLRTKFDNNASFSELLQQVKETTLGAYTHQDLPFEKLVEELKPKRHLNRNPLFDVMFTLQNAPVSKLTLPGLTLSSLEDESRTTIFDLSLDMFEFDERLKGILEYSTDLFKPSTIARMLEHFQVLLEAIVTQPEIPLSELSLLTEEEIEQILFDWNDNQGEYPVDKCISRLFESQVAKTPDAIAAVFENKQLTYKQLNAQANQLARLLINLGIQPGEFVGIYQQRSLNFLVAMLAVLKVGAVYLPLDDTYPIERIQYMISDSQVRFLLTDAEHIDCLFRSSEFNSHLQYLVSLDKKPVISIEITIYDCRDWQNLSADNLAIEIKPTGVDPAYIIYTSGSTGRPKGTIIRHGGAINHIYAQYDALNLSSDLTFLQSAPASSDISVWQFLAPVLIGGKTVIIDTKTVCNPDKLLRVLQQEQTTLVELVPVVLRGLINYLDNLSEAERQLPSLRWMMVTGESVAVDLVNSWLNLYPTIPIVNAYGPSEASDDITQAIIDRPLPEEQTTVPIGKPLANLNLYILDSNLNLVPIGVPGEICVSGYGVGTGYWHNEEKIQQTFIPNPFPKTAKLLPGVDKDLLYKTGDLGKWLPDGSIEYLGRIDNQVKIHGFRIELGEIEAQLQQYVAVRDCVVIASEDSQGQKRLVAYYISKEQLNSKQLREYLKPKLPEYMIPSAWMQLEEFPLTPNGKCDRNALPVLDLAIARDDYLAPRNSQEEILVTIWQEILKIDRVGINDNFFELGGHSLMATQVVSKIRQSLSIDLPLRALFERPTVAELASQLQSNSVTEIPPIKPVSRERDLPLSFAQQRLWFLAQLEPDSPAYNIPEALRLQGKLDIEVLTQTLKEIVRRHEVLRTNFTTVADRPVQIIRSQIDLKLPIIDLRDLPKLEREREVTKLAEREVLHSFDLERDSLLRVTLIRLDKLEHIIFLTMHHIISDGWSTGILVAEVASIYQAFLAGKPSPLPELPIQYIDYAVWQRDYLQGDTLDKQLNYWKQKLGGQLPRLKLPYRQQQPAVKTNRSLSHEFELSQKLTLSLKQLSRQTETTMFMVILTTLKTLLYRYSQQDDIVVGADIANRNRAETEALIGFFVNLLVLRSNLSGYPSFKELLARVKDVTLSAYAHQDLPFDRLVRELSSSRRGNQTPLFQVLLVMDNVPSEELNLPDLTITSLKEVDNYAKFDLVLFIAETKAGIIGNWQYNSDLFESQTIAKLSDSYLALLENVVANPVTRINKLVNSESTEEEQKKTIKAKRKFQQFLKFKPKAIDLPSSKELIKTSFLGSDLTLPLVITPAIKDLDIFDWVKNENQFLENKLLQHGAILFRDCQIDSISDFENLAQTICPNLFGNYGDLPRTEVSQKVYGSTPYPADKTILFHNESSHLHCYSQKIWFFCIQPAREGGETPIADCRQVYQLLDPLVREKLAQKQLMYVRNYIEGLDVRWQDFFQTEDKSVVENNCLKSGMEFEWLPNNGLRTRKIRPAIVNHIVTQEAIFFNQIQLHHISYLGSEVRASLLSVFGAENLPRNVYYGDSSPIEPEDIDSINRAYQQATVSFPWQKGDILMLDNMLTAHSRNPYKGDRKIVVAMGEMIDSSNK